MSIFPKSISWNEPWNWEVAKERVRERYKLIPPMWRLGVYCLVVIAILVAARIYYYPESKDVLTWGRIISTAAIVFVFYGVFAPISCMAPGQVVIMEKWICRIDVKNIISLSFETRNGRRYFVIKGRDKNGLPRERIALMAKKGVTEEDVRRFLYDVNLAHLYVVPADAANEAAEDIGQDS